MTVKGLEPEIQRLIAQHKTELKKIKSVHEAELLHSDERAAQKYVKMTEELREQLHQEKEAACARERELARQTYDSLFHHLHNRSCVVLELKLPTFTIMNKNMI